MSTGVNLGEFLSGFLSEAEDHLRGASANMILVDAAVSKDQPAPRAVRELFRSLHTIKGLAAMVGVEPIVEIAHEMESILRAADRQGGRLPKRAIEPLLAGLDGIGRRVRALAEGKSVAPAPASLIETLAAVDAASASPAPSREALELDETLSSKLSSSDREQLAGGLSSGKNAYQLSFVPSPERAAAGLTITTVRERLANVAELVKVVPVSTPKSATVTGGLTFVLLLVFAGSAEALADAAGLEASSVRVVGTAHSPPLPATRDELPGELAEFETEHDEEHGKRSVVRVDVTRLDLAMERLSALVVTRFRLARAIDALAAAGADVREIRQVAAENARQLRDMRASIVELRMIRVAELLEPLPLLVRGLRTSTGKDVKLHLEAGNTELDKSVAERLWPAIVHLVRNAIDHGIEAPEARALAGKPQEGNITVRAIAHSTSQLELSIEDDGAGIDAVRVAARAGREVPTHDGALLDLLCLAGLSTREVANSTSGRGMGMDIVKRITVEQLGGELRLYNSPGHGARFTLRVPLTVAIVDAFRFECAAQSFLVPVAAIDEIVEIEPSHVVRGPHSESSNAVLLLERRGAMMPLVRLASLLSLTGGTGGKALVVRRNGEAFAFAVDRLMGQQEVVVRPMLDPLVKVMGISGSTDLGDGRPTLMLDLVALSGLLNPGASA